MIVHFVSVPPFAGVRLSAAWYRKYKTPSPIPSLQFLRLSTWQTFLPHHLFPSMSTHCNIDDGSKPEILSTPTEALSSIPVIRVDELVPPALSTPSGCHSREPSDPSVTPPPLIISAQSPVHFTTPMALQDDKPEGGMASLALINPTDHSISHSRRPSYATVTHTDDGTITEYRFFLEILSPILSYVLYNITSFAPRKPGHRGSFLARLSLWTVTGHYCNRFAAIISLTLA